MLNDDLPPSQGAALDVQQEALVGGRAIHAQVHGLLFQHLDHARGQCLFFLQRGGLCG